MQNLTKHTRQSSGWQSDVTLRNLIINVLTYNEVFRSSKSGCTRNPRWITLQMLNQYNGTTIRGVASCLVPLVPPTAATLRRHGGHNLTFCLSLPAGKTSGSAWQDLENSATLGKAWMLTQGDGGGHAALVLKSIQNKVTTGSLCQQELASQEFNFSLSKSLFFLSSSHLKGKQILHLEAAGSLLSFLEKVLL